MTNTPRSPMKIYRCKVCGNEFARLNFPDATRCPNCESSLINLIKVVK